MEKKKYILEELQELNSSIGQVANCFEVPIGYFDIFYEEVITRIKEQQLPHRSFQVFTVPVNYFEDLPATILSHVTQQLPSSALPFAVPENYFDGLANNILQKIKTNTAEETVAEELQNISGFVANIPKTNVFTVPENYFNQLGVNIPANKEEAKVEHITSTKRWVRYVAAACVIGLIALGGYVWLSNGKTDSSNSFTKAASIEKNIAKLSDTEIYNYLSTHPASSDIINVSAETAIPDINTSIQNMSDDEIQQYLDNNEEPGEKEIKGI
jgi:hypothetical protein